MTIYSIPTDGAKFMNIDINIFFSNQKDTRMTGEAGSS